jgi:hypothetical protein
MRSRSVLLWSVVAACGAVTACASAPRQGASTSAPTKATPQVAAKIEAPPEVKAPAPSKEKGPLHLVAWAKDLPIGMHATDGGMFLRTHYLLAEVKGDDAVLRPELIRGLPFRSAAGESARNIMGRFPEAAWFGVEVAERRDVRG